MTVAKCSHCSDCTRKNASPGRVAFAADRDCSGGKEQSDLPVGNFKRARRMGGSARALRSLMAHGDQQQRLGDPKMITPRGAKSLEPVRNALRQALVTNLALS